MVKVERGGSSNMIIVIFCLQQTMQKMIYINYFKMI